MKNPRILLLLSLITISIPLVLAQSASSSASPSLNITADSYLSTSSINITIGSSISASSNKSSFWLSPSGIFAFGFYPLSNEYRRYNVGVWIAKSSDKTLVWNVELSDDEPVDNTSSVVLNHDGVLVLRREGYVDKPLLGYLFQRASYAMLQDTGNFVLYDSDAQAIWQSFDYPTDTILSSQTLKFGHRLISNNSQFQLTMQKNGNLVIHKKDLQKHRNQVNSNVVYIRTGRTDMMIIERNQVDSTDDPGECRWESRTHKKLSPIVLNLGSTGHLSLVDWDGLVIKNLTEAEEHPRWSIVGSLIYRATMEPDGIFRLYGEKIQCNCGKSILLWQSECTSCKRKTRENIVMLCSISVALIAFAGFVWWLEKRR